jgi:hypothetical protein
METSLSISISIAFENGGWPFLADNILTEAAPVFAVFEGRGFRTGGHTFDLGVAA